MGADEKMKIKVLFRGYRRVSATMLRTLEEYGLAVSGGGKHYKICRTDHIGGCVTMPKTPSDFRTGLNVSQYIIRLLQAND